MLRTPSSPRRPIDVLCVAGALLILLLIGGSPAVARSLTATFTADNAYELWSGTASAVLARLGGAENCLASEWRGAETFGAVLPDAATHLYLVAYSDDSGGQGVLGSLDIDGRGLLTGDAGWEVFATGVDRDLACATPPGAGPPSALEIDSRIAIANANAGSPATTSGGWVDLQGGGSGTLAVGGANQLPAGPPLNEVITGIDPLARWMWYAPPGVANPFSGGGTHREFLIFRMPLSVLDRCTLSSGIRSTRPRRRPPTRSSSVVTGAGSAAPCRCPDGSRERCRSLETPTGSIRPTAAIRATPRVT